MITDRQLTFDVRNGWTTPQGMEACASTCSSTRRRRVVINLGTNDGSRPAASSPTASGASSRAVPPRACIVWPSIIRPPRKGAYKGLNRVLRDAARQDPRMTGHQLGPDGRKGTVSMRDGIHPTTEGYRFRAWVTAAAVRRGCRANRPA